MRRTREYGMQFWSVFFIVGAALVFAGGCGSVDAGKYVSSGETTQERVERTASYYVKERRDTCAFVLLRVEDGSTVTASAGVAHAETREAPGEDTLFRLASMSKIMIYIVALRLHEEGRVNLDAPIMSYSRLKLADVYAEVTLRDLLNHRSGLPREFLGFWETWDVLSSGLFGTDIYRSFCTKEKLYKALNDPRWQGGVRKKTAQYSNVGFGLFGVLLEDATGESLEQLLQRYVCEPLGLKDTTFEPDEEQRRRIAMPCAGDLPWFHRRSSPIPEHGLGDGMKATGCIFSTPRDVKRFIDYYWTVIQTPPPYSSLGVMDELAFCCRIWDDGDGDMILYRVGMYYGSANFIGFDLRTRTTLLIFRNNTDWPDLDGVKILKAMVGREDGGK